MGLPSSPPTGPSCRSGLLCRRRIMAKANQHGTCSSSFLLLLTLRSFLSFIPLFSHSAELTATTPLSGDAVRPRRRQPGRTTEVFQFGLRLLHVSHVAVVYYTEPLLRSASTSPHFWLGPPPASSVNPGSFHAGGPCGRDPSCNSRVTSLLLLRWLLCLLCHDLWTAAVGEQSSSWSLSRKCPRCSEDTHGQNFPWNCLSL